MAWANPLDSTDPLDTAPVSGGAGELRTFKAAIVERLNTIFADFANGQPLVWVAPSGMQGAGPPTSGPAGTGANAAAAGTFYFDTTAKVQYMNINTKASPTWAPILLGDSV